MCSQKFQGLGGLCCCANVAQRDAYEAHIEAVCMYGA